MRKHSRLSAPALCATALLLLLAVPAQGAAEGRYLVVFKEGRTQQGVAAVRAAGGRALSVNRKVGVASVRARSAAFLTAIRGSRAVQSAGREGAFRQPELKVTAVKARAAAAKPQAADVAAACVDTYGSFGPEPLSPCQWDMRLINATPTGSYAVNQGAGATVGIIDTGIDLTHPDLVQNIDVAKSCSFIRADTPTSVPQEQATSCAEKQAVQDYDGHGTHVAGTVAAPINGQGVAGVAPQAKVAGLHAGTAEGYFFTQPVVDALTWAGDQRLDVVNMSFFVDPYLFNCKNQADQRAIVDAIQRASQYAAARGVVQIASAGNEETDLDHPRQDTMSPDYPPDSEVDRRVRNNCVIVPGELPDVSATSSVGPDRTLSFYSNYGSSKVAFTAPGGDSTQRTEPFGRVLSTWSSTAGAPSPNPNRSVEDCSQPQQGCVQYAWLQGTSMASPHAVGVAALIRAANPGLPPKAVIAREQQTAQAQTCPADDSRCTGGARHTNFYGSGLVDALAASQK